MENSGSAVGGVFFFLALIAIWALPIIIAAARKHHNTTPIALVCIFLGWTGIGWIAALIWSFTSPPKASVITVIQQAPSVGQGS